MCCHGVQVSQIFWDFSLGAKNWVAEYACIVIFKKAQNHSCFILNTQLDGISILQQSLYWYDTTKWVFRSEKHCSWF